MRRMVLAAALAMFAGCTTTEGFDAFAQGFVGQSERAIIDRFGVPNGSYETDGAKYLSFTRSSMVYHPGTPASYQSNVVGSTVYTNAIGGSGPSAYESACTLTFRIERGVVAGYQHRGNACLA